MTKVIHDLRSAITLKLLSVALAVAPADEKYPLATALRKFALTI